MNIRVVRLHRDQTGAVHAHRLEHLADILGLEPLSDRLSITQTCVVIASGEQRVARFRLPPHLDKAGELFARLLLGKGPAAAATDIRSQRTRAGVTRALLAVQLAEFGPSTPKRLFIA
ncbi:MAG: hypothetical protein R3B46_04370 [Phycisphaerales bacterium]